MKDFFSTFAWRHQNDYLDSGFPEAEAEMGIHMLFIEGMLLGKTCKEVRRQVSAGEKAKQICDIASA